MNLPRVHISREYEGYYRLFVSPRDQIDNVNCRVVSDSIYIKVADRSKASDIRIDVCPLPDRNINLTSYLDSLAHNTVSWKKISSPAPNVTNPEKGTINTAGLTGTYKYQYKMTSTCEPDSAIAYIHPLKDRFSRRINPIVVCKDEEKSRNINISHILGLDIDGGTWTYDDSNDIIKNNLKEIPSSSGYYGAMIFDAYQAWQKANTTGVTDFLFPAPDYYKGDAKAMKFVFHYTNTSSDSCIGNVNIDIEIIVTETMF
jgi:hypothetical protein